MTKRNLNTTLQYVLVEIGLDFHDMCKRLCALKFVENANGHPSRTPDPENEYYGTMRLFLAKDVIIRPGLEEMIQTILENMANKPS